MDALSDFSEEALIALNDLVEPEEDMPQSDRFLRLIAKALEAKRLGGAAGPASTEKATANSGDDSSQGLPDSARELEDALREVATIHHRCHRGVAPNFRHCSVLTCQRASAALSAAATTDTKEKP